MQPTRTNKIPKYYCSHEGCEYSLTRPDLKEVKGFYSPKHVAAHWLVMHTEATEAALQEFHKTNTVAADVAKMYVSANTQLLKGWGDDAIKFATHGSVLNVKHFQYATTCMVSTLLQSINHALPPPIPIGCKGYPISPVSPVVPLVSSPTSLGTVCPVVSITMSATTLSPFLVALFELNCHTHCQPCGTTLAVSNIFTKLPSAAATLLSPCGIHPNSDATLAVLWYLPIAAKQCDCIEFFQRYFEKTSKLLIFPTECDFTNHTKNSRNQASSGDHEPCTVGLLGKLTSRSMPHQACAEVDFQDFFNHQGEASKGRGRHWRTT
jgi:hypothetical protein